MGILLYATDLFASNIYTDKVNSFCRKAFTTSGLRFFSNKLLEAYYGNSIEIRLMNQDIVFESPNFEEFMILRGLKSDKPILEDIADALDENKTFYDIGANIGLYTCTIGKVTGCDVYSFEPHPKNSKKLSQNAERNNLSFTLIEKAASDKDGAEKISIEKNVSGEGQVNLTESGNGTEIESCRLDNLIGDELPSPDVAKIDVEGAEIKVLEGMQNLDKTQMPETIYCEVHPTVERHGSTPEEVEQKLQQLGYKLETLEKMFGNRRMIKAEITE